MLADASAFVRPGGVLAYATCSLLPPENRDRIAAFLAAHPGFTPVDPREAWGEALQSAAAGCGAVGKIFSPDAAPHGHGRLFHVRAAALRVRDANPAKPIPEKLMAAQQPIDVHYWPTPNGWKVTIMLEELGVPYNVKLVNIGKGDQFKPEFLAISPNNRMPAIVDPDGPGGKPISVFELAGDPDLPRPEIRKVLSGGRAQARRGRGVARLADRQCRPDFRQRQSLPQLRPGEDCLRDPALRQRKPPPLRRARQAAEGTGVRRRRLFHRRHGADRLGQGLRAARDRHRRISRA